MAKQKRRKKGKRPNANSAAGTRLAKRRARTLSPRPRREIARRAANARWKRTPPQGGEPPPLY